jgi:hypothetical protein
VSVSKVTGASGAAGKHADSMQYRVKFVCGFGDGKILGLGNYFTAINVHNASEDAVASIRMKFAVALPNEGSPGHSDFIGSFDITPDDALEIDCQEIIQRAGKLCPREPAGFCKGFVVIESSASQSPNPIHGPGLLDVVAVYTAADPTTGHTTTLHTDRVTPHCPIRTDKVPQQTILFVRRRRGVGTRIMPVTDRASISDLGCGLRTMATLSWPNTRCTRLSVMAILASQELTSPRREGKVRRF